MAERSWNLPMAHSWSVAESELKPEWAWLQSRGSEPLPMPPAVAASRLHRVDQEREWASQTLENPLCVSAKILYFTSGEHFYVLSHLFGTRKDSSGLTIALIFVDWFQVLF